MDFKSKKILLNKTLGERLRELREESNISLEALSEKLGLAKNYLQYLEEGKYENLPGEVYIISFLKKYAQAVQINEDKVLKLYEKERNIYKKLKSEDSRLYLPPKAKVNFSPFNPKFFRNLIIIVLVLGILVYLAWELTHVIAPPRLEITYPPDKLVTQEKNLTIVGETEAEVKILVNGKEVFVDTEGKFKEEIILNEGVNVIKISAYKKQGRENTVTRQILSQTEQ